MTFTIRRVEPKDFERVLELHIEGLKQFGSNIGDPSMDQDIHHIQEVYIDDGGEFFVGEIEGRIVCMGAYKKRDIRTAEVKRIRVDQYDQRQGYGQRILSTLENSARAKGYRRLLLDTTTRQEPAMKLFEKHGYTETSRKTLGEVTVVFYEKELC
ncbi:GNAT family N-acetyltransferase [Marinicrinis lubricantis]|uniref:GNAT family N-acetyltransferase n=1 Tax=Marinicrinis lubricantis TaxID=2086470 RepID=A0ABW1IQ47_9BACL